MNSGVHFGMGILLFIKELRVLLDMKKWGKQERPNRETD